MKKWISALALLMITSAASAADGWLTDFAKAKEQAKTENKYMLMDFSGSDWCGWCIKLDKEVFAKPDFQKYAKTDLVMMLVDAPRRTKLPADVKAQNDRLAKEFGIRGYPTVILLSPDGKVAGRTGYQKGGPKAYVAHIKELIKTYEAK